MRGNQEGMNIKDTAIGAVKEVTSHWSKPGKGNFVSYKEVLNLGLGGMGQRFVMIMTGYLSLSAGNTCSAPRSACARCTCNIWRWCKRCWAFFSAFCAAKLWITPAPATGVSAPISP